MPVTTTTEAARAVAVASADRAHKAALARERADTITPLREYPPVEDLPADLGRQIEDVKPKKAQITLSTTVEHRGRSFTIQAEGITLDQFCDLLDQRGYAPATQAALAAPLAAADDLPEGWKLCKKHGAPMRPRNKQNEHWHSHNVGTGDAPLWCKGYRGSDSPGYEVG